MIKVLFESSIFLHQKVGGVSKYIFHMNENLSESKYLKNFFTYNY